jgi:hypothetical protein
MIGLLRTRARLLLALLTMKYWEIIADKLSEAGWAWGYCSAVTQHGWRWVVDASCGDGRRYIVEADELLSAFLELERVTSKAPS